MKNPHASYDYNGDIIYDTNTPKSDSDKDTIDDLIYELDEDNEIIKEDSYEARGRLIEEQGRQIEEKSAQIERLKATNSILSRLVGDRSIEIDVLHAHLADEKRLKQEAWDVMDKRYYEIEELKTLGSQVRARNAELRTQLLKLNIG